MGTDSGKDGFFTTVSTTSFTIGGQSGVGVAVLDGLADQSLLSISPLGGNLCCIPARVRPRVFGEAEVELVCETGESMLLGHSVHRYR